MNVLESANLVLRFALEIGALVAVGSWGWHTGTGPVRWLLTVGTILAVIVVWVLFVSPEPMVELARPVRLAIESIVWGAAGAALWASGLRQLAIAFVVVAMVSGVLNYVWD